MSEASIYSTILIRSHGFETGQLQLPFGFTSMLANLSSQSEALKCYNDNDESVISPESNEEISQHKCEESVMTGTMGCLVKVGSSNEKQWQAS
ncbi:uncharacterized protein CIMG_12654 [Coccidioides immitis RS]|uniref:Uncharacterized protein n=1 Tax=Coccidioides immitis (strain RS) TaxID=246410 RepID=J3KLN9_COCIM|nr:uncharacterized protein CIMG_12654 [Coccidioides immitis RS]EAS37239.3 hypothetical protein CIMG_12654 [Coccidioides immitis RS]